MNIKSKNHATGLRCISDCTEKDTGVVGARHTRNSPLRYTFTAIAMACLAQSTGASGAPLSLATVPQGNGGREPAPNIIVSVDDSGSMGNSGMTSLRNALNDAFAVAKVPDNSIRLGFQAMWRCRGLSDNPYNTYGGACPDTRIKRFSGAHRTGFNNFVNSLLPKGGTPSHTMVVNAGDYMKTTGLFNPYGSDPGTTETPLLACRKSFHIFMTDGGWNSEINNTHGTALNADGTSRTLPDGTSYDTSAAETQTRVYRDAFGSATLSTLSDYAFQQWATDAQTTIANEVKPIIRTPGSINAGTAANPYLITEYWNPKNNPATWQSLTTYTIGFNDAANLPTSGAGNRPWFGGSTWAGGDYNNLLMGNVGWQNPIPGNYTFRFQELWHMALNGRGRFVPATSAAELTAAFNEILNQITLDTSTPLVGVSSSTQSARSDTLAFVAGYNALQWSGDLKGFGLNAAGGVNATAVWDAATQLNAVTPANRKIWTHDGTQGQSFLWANLADDQKAALQGADTAVIGQSRLNYLRGDRTQETSQTGGTLRTRTNLLGDIVNSAPWSVSKPNMGYLSDGYQAFRTANSGRLPMVYVGTNGGMLHGFAAKAPLTSGIPTLVDGAEKLAYVPRGVYSSLAPLTAPNYVHRYYVDGKPFTSDYHNGSAWKTALVGTLAGGGKGFFVLDVTNPAGFATATAADIANLVMTDKTAAFTQSTVVGQPLAAAWDDVGHMYSPPTQDNSNPARVVQITKLNNDRWALLMGNGINSTNETAVLLIQYLDGNKELVKLTADSVTGGGNGLSHPQVIDLNGDDKADLAYAGDIKGNLWKFDLTSKTASDWNVAFNGQPLFVAKGYPPSTPAGAQGEFQAIMTAPTWTTNPLGGLNLVFATGRDVTATDPASTAVQTLYSVWDNTAIQMPTTLSGVVTLTGGSRIPDSSSGGRASLLERTQTSTTTNSEATFFTTSSSTSVNYSGPSAKRGWFFNFPIAGERAGGNSRVIDKRLVSVPSVKVSLGSMTASTGESCEPAAVPAENYTTVLDAVTGKPYQKRPFFDTNGGGWAGGEIANVSRIATGKDPVLFVPVKSAEKFATSFKMINARPGGSTTDSGGNKFGGADSTVDAGVLDDPVRTSWRQLQ